MSANMENFGHLQTRINELEERIKKLEHDRDAMQNWGKQFDFMDKQSFESIGDKLKTFPEQIESLKSLVITKGIEIDALKYEKKYLLMEPLRLTEIIEQAREQISIEETTERTGTLINGIKTVQIDVMEFYKILSKFKDILEGST